MNNKMNNNPKNWNLLKRGMLPSRDITIEEYNNMIEKIYFSLGIQKNYIHRYKKK